VKGRSDWVFKETMHWAREHLGSKHAGTPAGAGLDSLQQRRACGDYLTRLIVKTGDKVVVLRRSTLMPSNLRATTSRCNSGRKAIFCGRRLSALEAQLDPKKFLRISRSAIVNLDRVKELLPMFKGEHVMVLDNGKHLATDRMVRRFYQDVSATSAATPPSPVQIFNTIQGYQRAFALKAAVDLDLFTAIAKGSRTVVEIAKNCNAAERGIRIMSDALVVMGFLIKSGNSYSLTPDTAFFLDSRSPAYLGLAFSFSAASVTIGPL